MVADPVTTPAPGATPGLPVPVPTDGTRPGTDPLTAGLDPDDPDVKKYNDAKAENANADKAVTDAGAQADEIIKQIKDFLLDVVGWTDLQKCISSGDVVACINTLINIVPWGKVFKLLKKIPGAVKLAKRLKELYDQVSGARKRKAAAEKALKEADDLLKKKPRKPTVCTLKPNSLGLRQISGKPLQSQPVAHQAVSANPCWDADPDVLDDIFDDFGPDISQGVEYNISRFNQGATNHAINGVGTDPRRLAEYLRGIRDRGFTHRDTKSGNGIFYDEANQVLVVQTPQDVHAYNLTKEEWADLLKKGRYSEN